MTTRIQKILNQVATMRLGAHWSDYFQELYDNAPFQIKKHFVLEQFISPILSTKEFWKERDILEATLTEKEWSYLLRRGCGGSNIARYYYGERMKKLHPEYDIYKHDLP